MQHLTSSRAALRELLFGLAAVAGAGAAFAGAAAVGDARDDVRRSEYRRSGTNRAGGARFSEWFAAFAEHAVRSAVERAAHARRRGNRAIDRDGGVPHAGIEPHLDRRS